MTEFARGSWLIVGCGYVGSRALSTLVAHGATVGVVTRDARRAAAWARSRQVRCFVGSYADPGVGRFASVLPAPLRILCLLPPAAFTDTQGTLGPLSVFSALLDDLRPARALLTSSTAAYGTRRGVTVAAETPCRPVTVRERRLCAIEERWLAGRARYVLRCAGLYGPGRIVGLTQIRDRDVPPGDPDAWLNLLHVDDAVSLLLRATLGASARIELGADGHPVARRDYYRALAVWAGEPVPSLASGTAEHGGRRCDPATTWARLRWRPMYTDFRAGLACCPLPPSVRRAAAAAARHRASPAP